MLEAKRDHWNTERGPRLERVPQRPVTGRGPGAGLPGQGEVDIVSEVFPADDQTRLVEEVFAGHAHPLAGLTPATRPGCRWASAPTARPRPGLRPAGLRGLAVGPGAAPGRPGGAGGRGPPPVRGLHRLPRVEVDLTLVPDDQILAAQHALVEKVLPPPLRHAGVRLAGPVLRRPSGLHAQPVLPQHRRRPCRTAHPAVRRPAGPVRHRHRPDTLAALTTDLDRLAYDQALGVFLGAPRPCTRSTGTSASTAAQPPSSWPRPRSPPAHGFRR